MERLIIYNLILLFSIKVTYTMVNGDISDKKPCTPGEVFKQNCNICKCKENDTLECSETACADVKPANEESDNVKNKIEKVKLQSRSDKSLDSPWILKCVPGKVYKEYNHLCFCNHKGKFRCSNETVPDNILIGEIRSPEKVYPRVTDDEYVNLPTLLHTAMECVPGRVYRVNCDICLCMQDGDLMCTDRLCLPEQGINRKQAARITGQPCNITNELKNMCIQCECVDDVLQCNPVSGCKSVLRNLHGHVKQRDTYISKSEKCNPDELILVNCNLCYCNGIRFVCTRRLCIRASQKLMLHAAMKKQLE